MQEEHELNLILSHHFFNHQHGTHFVLCLLRVKPAVTRQKTDDQLLQAGARKQKRAPLMAYNNLAKGGISFSHFSWHKDPCALTNIANNGTVYTEAMYPEI